MRELPCSGSHKGEAPRSSNLVLRQHREEVQGHAATLRPTGHRQRGLHRVGDSGGGGGSGAGGRMVCGLWDRRI